MFVYLLLASGETYFCFYYDCGVVPHHISRISPNGSAINYSRRLVRQQHGAEKLSLRGFTVNLGTEFYMVKAHRLFIFSWNTACLSYGLVQSGDWIGFKHIFFPGFGFPTVGNLCI